MGQKTYYGSHSNQYRRTFNRSAVGLDWVKKRPRRSGRCRCLTHSVRPRHCARHSAVGQQTVQWAIRLLSDNSLHTALGLTDDLWF